MLTKGDTAPDLSLLTADGTSQPLSDFFQTEFLLLVFVRHLV